MKNKKLKALLGAFFALAMAISVGTSLSFAKAHKPAEIVLAEGEEEQSSDDETAANDEQEAPTQEETPAQESEQSSDESQKEAGEDVPPVTAEGIFKVLAKTLRDALKDLINHIKRWFNLK